MKRSFLAALAMLLCTNLVLSQATLLKDINKGSGSVSSLDPGDFIAFKGKVYYSDTDVEHGRELWVTDGTTAGTTLVKDIFEGVSSSNPKLFIEMNNMLYFVAINDMYGSELWRTDGSSEGTVLVKDINPGKGGSFASDLIVIGNDLFMAAFHSEYGKELWRSDGTSTGTYLVKDINPGIQSSFPLHITNLNGLALFSAQHQAYGKELWRSDGSETGTYMVKDIGANERSSAPLYLTTFKNKVYFVLDSAYNGNALLGRQIWTSDGTSGGTSMFLSNDFENRYNHYYSFTAGKDHLYFTASWQNLPTKLWRTDGSSLDLIDQTDEIKTSINLVNIVDGKLLYYYDLNHSSSEVETHFVLLDDSSGEVIFDESKEYTVPEDFRSYVINPVRVVNDETLIWQLIQYKVPGNVWDDSFVSETHATLIRTQKNIGSTVIGVFGYSSQSMSDNYNGKILFGASIDQQLPGSSLYVSDGTTSGTSIIKSQPSANSSHPQLLTVLRDRVLLAANENTELWSSDGTTTGTIPIEENLLLSKISNMVAARDKIYFTASKPSTGMELWSIGEKSSVPVVNDIVPGNAGSSPGVPTVLGNELIFIAEKPDGNAALLKTDGVNLVTLRNLPGLYSIQTLIKNPFGSILYFPFDDGIHGMELWKTDGTANGTTLVRDIVPGTAGTISYAGNLINSLVINDVIYFQAYYNGKDALWRSDGTEAGTMMVKAIEGESYVNLMNFCRYGDNKFIFSNSNGSIWASDGTAAGTIKLKDFPFEVIDFNASGPQITLVAALADTVYFFKGKELWKTDGTQEGTRFIEDFEEYSDYSYNHVSISNAAVLNDRMYFIAYSPTNEYYLWSTNGTPGSMRKIYGVKNVQNLVVMKDALYFSGEGRDGNELWKYTPEHDLITSIDEKLDNVVVYPNPTSDSFTIVKDASMPLKIIELVDNTGRRIPFTVIPVDEKQIGLKIGQGYSGVYILRMEVGTRLEARKVIKK